MTIQALVHARDKFFGPSAAIEVCSQIRQYLLNRDNEFFFILKSSINQLFLEAREEVVVARSSVWVVGRVR